MKRFNKRQKLALIVILLISLFNSQLMVFGQEISTNSDINDSWAREQIIKWQEKGVVKGYPDGRFKPNSEISRAEFITIINKALGYQDQEEEQAYIDVSKSKWYFGEVSKAKLAGYISSYEDGTFKPERNISRQEVATIIFNLMKLNNVNNEDSLKEFKDIDKIPDWSRDYINTVVQNGYLSGYPDKTFRPSESMTRAEAIATMDRIIGTLIDSPGSYGDNKEQNIVKGNITINTEKVTLNNTLIEGDLYLTAGIGEGEVYLNNVTVEGRTIVNGGGENSVILNDSTINELLVERISGRVRIVTRGGSQVAKAIIKTGAKLQEENKGNGFRNVEISILNSDENIQLSGEFENILVRTKSLLDILEDTQVNTLETSVEAEGTILNVKDNSVLKEVVLNTATDIEGSGSIGMVIVNTKGSTIEQDVEEYQLSDDVDSVDIGGETVTENPQSPSNNKNRDRDSDDEDDTNNDGDTNNEDNTDNDLGDGDEDTDLQPAPLEVQGTFIVNNKLYTKFNYNGDYSLVSWTMENTEVNNINYHAEYNRAIDKVGVFTIEGEEIEPSNYSIYMNDNGLILNSVMLSSTTVGEAVYGYVYYSGNNTLSFDVNDEYYVDDLNNQITGEAIPLKNQDMIQVLYNGNIMLKATWNDSIQDWEYNNIIEIGKPEAPIGLSAEPLSNTEIQLTWEPVVEADYYHIYYSDSENGVYTPVSNSNGAKEQILLNSFVDASNSPNTTRYYKVSAVRNGLESDFSSFASATTYYNYHIKLDLNVTDTIQHPSQPVVYITDKENQKLYSINYETEEIDSILFDLPTESLTYADGKIYISLLKGEHSSYWDEKDQQGSIAIVDADTFEIIDIFDIALDPYDIAVDRNGFIYVAGGSGQWTDLKAYSGTTLTEIEASQIRQESYIHMHPTVDRLYTITTDSSPRDLTAYNILDGQFVEPLYPGGYDSPYHGDYDMNKNIKLSPDGKYIFNGVGTVFQSSESNYDDMKYVYTLNKTFTDIAFELNNNIFYTTNMNQVPVYSYENFEQIGYYNTDGAAKQLFNASEKLIAISTFNTNNVMEIIEKDSIYNLDPVYVEGIELEGTIVDVLYDEQAHKSYAIDEAFKNLFIIDMENQAVEATVKLPYRPSGLGLSEDGTKLYVVNDDENYLVTEVSLDEYQITRHLSFTSVPDSRDFSHRHIYNRSGKLFVVMGNWSPELLVFDVSTFEKIEYTLNGEYDSNNSSKADYSTPIYSVGDLAFSQDNSKFYFWYQYGWDAGWAGSDIFSFSVGENIFTQVDKTVLGYPNMDKDPLDSPVILLEDKGILICKDKVVNLSDLTNVLGSFPESIYAVNSLENIAVGKNGLYNLDTYEKIESLSLTNSIKIFFDKNQTLYYLKDNVLQSY